MKQHYFQPLTFTVPLSFAGVLCEGSFPTDPATEYPGSGELPAPHRVVLQ